MWKKLSSVVINYIFVYCQKSMELPRSIKSFLFFAEIMKSRPWDSLLCYGWLNGKGVVMLLQKSSIASRIIWIFDSSHTIHTTVCLLDMFNEHASSSFHSCSCFFRQGYHRVTSTVCDNYHIYHLHLDHNKEPDYYADVIQSLHVYADFMLIYSRYANNFQLFLAYAYEGTNIIT